MQFTNLNLLTIIIFLIGILSVFSLFFFYYKKQKIIGEKFEIFRNKKYFYIKFIFLFFSFIIIFISIFGIKTFGIGNSKQNGIDIVFVLDVSKSMNVADISDGNYNYTRLDFIKNSIGDFVSKHKNDRFGLVIFSGDASSVVPLTNDHNIFLTFLENVDYRNLIKQGSDFKKALKMGNNRLNYSENKNGALVFISDGADEDVDLKNIKSLKDKRISYFIAGVGTKDGGRIITGKSPFGDLIYQKYNGKYVISSLNEKNLKYISDSLDGEYQKLDKISDINKFSKSMENLEKKVFKNNSLVENKDFSRDLAILSFIFFIIFFMIYLFEKR